MITFNELPEAVSQLMDQVQLLRNEIKEMRAEKGIEKPSGEVMNVKQAAEFLNRTSDAIYGLIARKEIPHQKKSSRLTFLRTELIEWLKAGQVETQEESNEAAHRNMVAIYKKKKKPRCNGANYNN